MAAGEKERERLSSKIVRCSQHGESPFCWVQSGGEHIDDSRCQCHTDSRAECRVDVHRKDARVHSEVFYLVTQMVGKKLDHRGTER